MARLTSKQVTEINAKTAAPKSAAKVTKSDVITVSKNAANGAAYLAVDAPGNPTLLIPHNRLSADLRKLANVGGSYKALVAAWKVVQANPPVAKLANGVDSRSAPHASKAVADAKAKSTPAKAAPKAKADGKKAERKAERAAKAAPKGDDKRAITIVKKDFAFGREGTARRSSWDKAMKAKTVAAYIAAGGAAKYLPRWVSAGAIKLV